MLDVVGHRDVRELVEDGSERPEERGRREGCRKESLELLCRCGLLDDGFRVARR